MTDEEFRAMLQENINKFKLGHRDVAHIVGTSVTTVTRWITGQSAPHQLIRPAIKKMFEEECLD